MADTLGAFEQAVLLAVLRLGDGAYGRAILGDVQARLERDVVAGAVHATLDRLERKGFLSSSLGSGTAVRDGRARRRALDEARYAHKRVWHGVSDLLKGRNA
jgi:PadR family transcriptional regulator, regulatory protein PadR